MAFDDVKAKIIDLLEKMTNQPADFHDLAGSVGGEWIEQGKLIDDSVNLWEDIFSVKLVEIMKKINKEWKEESE